MIQVRYRKSIAVPLEIAAAFFFHIGSNRGIALAVSPTSHVPRLATPPRQSQRRQVRNIRPCGAEKELRRKQVPVEDAVVLLVLEGHGDPNHLVLLMCIFPTGSYQKVVC